MFEPGITPDYFYVKFNGAVTNPPTHVPNSLQAVVKTNLWWTMQPMNLGFMESMILSQFQYHLLPYSHNPSNWPEDPNLSQISFTMQWGRNTIGHGYTAGREIISVELPLSSGAKLILGRDDSTNPGTSWIIEPSGTPGQFRILCADDPTLCMCSESIDEDTFVTLTEERGENTLMTCEMNEDEQRHHSLHDYKFVSSDLFLSVRLTKFSWITSTRASLGSYIVQNFKTPDQNTKFRLGNGGMNIDMSERPNGDLRSLYSDWYGPFETTCLCGDTFDETTELEEHKKSCLCFKPKLFFCQGCRKEVEYTSLRTQLDHYIPCIANPSGITGIDPDLVIPGSEGGGSGGGSSAADSEAAEVEENKKKLVTFRTGCSTAPCSADILVCSTCKKKKGCVFCGSPSNLERLKSCSTCKEKPGGGAGKVTGRHTHQSAGCINCGKFTQLVLYNVCITCKRKYGSQCYYNFVASFG